MDDPKNGGEVEMIFEHFFVLGGGDVLSCLKKFERSREMVTEFFFKIGTLRLKITCFFFLSLIFWRRGVDILAQEWGGEEL